MPDEPGDWQEISEAELSDLDEMSDASSLSLWSAASLVVRWYHLIIVLALASGTAMGTWLLTSDREYTALASFVPQEPTGAQSGLGQLATSFGLSSATGDANSPQFYADLLLSRQVLRDVVQTRYRASLPAPREGDLMELFGINHPSPDLRLRDTMRHLTTVVSVNVSRTTGVIRFRVNTTSPDLSEQVARRFLDLVNDYNLRRRRTRARAERDFVEQSLARAQATLTSAEDALAAFYRGNRRFQDSPELLSDEARLQRQIAVAQGVYLALSQRFEDAKIEEVRNTPVITVIEPPEGFVEPRARGTVVKSAFATIFGGLLAVGIGLGLEYLSRERDRQSEEYREFTALAGGIIKRFRSMFSSHANA